MSVPNFLVVFEDVPVTYHEAVQGAVSVCSNIFYIED